MNRPAAAPWPSACLLACATLVAGCTSCLPRSEPAEPSGPVAQEIVLSEPPAAGEAGGLFGPSHPSLRATVEAIDHAAKDPLVKGLFLRFGGMKNGWATVAELARAIARVRAAHKPVHCHFENADNASYALLAESCDRLSMTPAGYLDLVGLAAQVLYAEPLLDKLGVRAEVVRMGRFKNAADPLVRADMPETTREELGALLDGLQGSLLDAVAGRIGGDRAAAQATIDQGPFDAIEARAAHLVDDVGFDDEAREHLREAAAVQQVDRVDLMPKREPLGVRAILEALGGKSESRTPSEPHVALVYVTGAIIDGDEQKPDVAVSDPFVRELRRLADDRDVRAIVLRVDSPGGSALASDRMWHAVRRAAKRKPVFASLGDMAASGGYYIASAAKRIYAEPVSLVGSIGVLAGKLDVGPLADRVGVRSVVLTRGAHAAWSSIFSPLDPSERAVLERALRSSYYRFIRRVAAGRGITREQVLAAAGGRVLTGAAGKTLHLVDDFGGLEDALDAARSAGSVSADTPLSVWPRRSGLLDAIADATGDDHGRSQAAGALEKLRALGPLTRPLVESAWLLPLLDGRPAILAAAPYVVDIR